MQLNPNPISFSFVAFYFMIFTLLFVSLNQSFTSPNSTFALQLLLILYSFDGFFTSFTHIDFELKSDYSATESSPAISLILVNVALFLDLGLCLVSGRALADTSCLCHMSVVS